MLGIKTLRTGSLICAALGLLLVIVSSCPAASINDYQTENDEERAVLAVIIAYRDGLNSGQWEKVLELFTPEARISAGQEGGEVSLEEYRRDHLERNRANYQKRSCFTQFDPPTLLEITGRTALVKAGCSLACEGQEEGKPYLHIGPVWVGLVKTDKGWRISKFLESRR
jgi:hypothetical protein